MSTRSMQAHQCNHRGMDVAVMGLVALVTAETAGISMSLLGQTPPYVLAAAGGSFVAAFTIAMAIVQYLRRSS